MLGIYPEGTRSPDGRLYKGHTGVARLSMQCDAPVIPVAQFGTAAVQPIGSMWPKLFRRVRVKLGPPLRWEGGGDGASELRQFTDRLMTAIAALSGQEMVDRYASRDRGPAGGSGLRGRAHSPRGAPDAGRAGVAAAGRARRGGRLQV